VDAGRSIRSIDERVDYRDRDTGESRPLNVGGPTRGLVYSADGRRLAIAGKDGVIRICDGDTGELRGACQFGIGPPYERSIRQPIAFGPDDRTIVSVAQDNHLQTTQIDTGTDIWRTAVADQCLYGLAFGPGGGVLASAGTGANVRVQETATGRHLLTLRGHTKAVKGLTVLADGRVVTACQDGTIVLWEPAGSVESATLGPATTSITVVAISPDGRRVAAGTLAGPTWVWDTETGHKLFTVPGHPQRTNGVTFTPDGERLITVGHDPVARVWSAADGRWLFDLVGHTGGLRHVAVSGDGQRLATSGDGTVRIWDAGTGRALRVVHTGQNVVWSSAVFSPDGRYVAGSTNEAVCLWDIDSREVVVTLPIPKAKSIGYRPGGRHLAVATYQSELVEVWDVSGSGSPSRPVFRLHGHLGPDLVVEYSSDGRRIVTSGKDGTIRIWDAADGRELLVLQGNGDGDNLALSRDSKRMAMGFGARVRMWEAFALQPELLQRRRLTD
jgi:WD40 repeat protein